MSINVEDQLDGDQHQKIEKVLKLCSHVDPLLAENGEEGVTNATCLR
jgi:hypothetical protein